MTKFEQVGVNFQQGALNKHEANRNFRYSCRICCNRGMQIDCDSCAISVSNTVTLAAFDVLSNSENSKGL